MSRAILEIWARELRYADRLVRDVKASSRDVVEDQARKHRNRVSILLADVLRLEGVTEPCIEAHLAEAQRMADSDAKLCQPTSPSAAERLAKALCDAPEVYRDYVLEGAAAVLRGLGRGAPEIDALTTEARRLAAVFG